MTPQTKLQNEFDDQGFNCNATEHSLHRLKNFPVMHPVKLILYFIYAHSRQPLTAARAPQRLAVRDDEVPPLALVQLADACYLGR